MPRSGRGGKRQGQVGQSYAQRSDLRAAPVTAAPGQGYGERKAQEDSQAAVPMAQTAPIPRLPAFDRPTERPQEPITAGVPIGPGPNQPQMPMLDPVAETLRAAYAQMPTDEIARLLESLQ